MAIIYLITNTINGKQYVGFTSRSIDERVGEHIRSQDASYLHKAMRHYGKDAFEYDIIFEHDDCEFTLTVMEPYFIEWYDTYENGYNLTEGGEGSPGTPHTIERRTAQSHWMKLNNPMRNSESRQKISDKLKGRKFTPEWRAKLSKKAKQVRHRGKPYIIIHPNGTEETIQNLASFCRMNNLQHSALHAVAKGNRKHHKGYKLRYIPE